MRFRKEGDEDDFHLEMTPMIDVVFLLLIFFMVSTAFVDFSRRMDISLPESKSSVPDEISAPLLIEMTENKRLFMNGEEISLSRFEQELENLPEEKRPSATIKADKALPYGDVIQIMGLLQNARIRDISVAVK